MVKNLVEENLYIDFKPMAPVTNQTREQNRERTITGSIRMGASNYRTDKEKRKFIHKAWKARMK